MITAEKFSEGMITEQQIPPLLQMNESYLKNINAEPTITPFKPFADVGNLFAPFIQRACVMFVEPIK
jgi:hypothetical protein